jgi:hypothetical protein
MFDHNGTSLKPAASGERTPLAALRRFAQPRARRERCELCGATIWPRHPHLLELKSRRLVCSCDACAVLFADQQAATFRRVPRESKPLPGFRLSDAQWEDLLIPIGLAFFFYKTDVARVVAVYPSPAGPTESLLQLDAWQSLVDDNAVLDELLPDVEALLVNRLRRAEQYYRVPIDECYRLVGLIRTHWRGLSGGGEVWEEVDKFFKQMEERSCSN